MDFIHLFSKHARGHYEKTILLFVLLSSIAFAKTSISLGGGPYHELLSIEQTFQTIPLSVNIHIPSYDSEYDFWGGIGVAYYFNGDTGPYAFHSSEWIHASDWNRISTIYDRNGGFAGFKNKSVEINYWQLVFGVGYQHMFYKHFGAYFELGYEFYAGNGGYYTHFDRDHATLDNEELVFPAGFGLKFSF